MWVKVLAWLALFAALPLAVLAGLFVLLMGAAP
jgi:hypothetical protein